MDGRRTDEEKGLTQRREGAKRERYEERRGATAEDAETRSWFLGRVVGFLCGVKMHYWGIVQKAWVWVEEGVNEGGISRTLEVNKSLWTWGLVLWIAAGRPLAKAQRRQGRKMERNSLRSLAARRA